MHTPRWSKRVRSLRLRREGAIQSGDGSLDEREFNISLDTFLVLNRENGLTTEIIRKEDLSISRGKPKGVIDNSGQFNARTIETLIH
jgi:hypothetical protein